MRQWGYLSKEETKTEQCQVVEKRPAVLSYENERLKQENEKLKKQLELKNIHIEGYQKMIEIARDKLGVDIEKK